jgi:hypothetical protein
MRFASPNPASRPIRVGCLLAVAMLAGCSRDLALPSPPTSPALTGFAPAAAYAGQLLRVTGSHFDADPASNTVNFAHASVRGLRFDGTDLVVRVPADAGDGAITVGNRDGTSEPSPEPFDYLGLGEPRRGQIVSSVPILHHPRRVHSVYYKTFIESELYGTRDGNHTGLVGYGTDTRGPDPYVSTTASAPWRSLLIYSLDDATGTTVTIVNELDGTWKQVYLDGVHPWRLVPVKGLTQADDLLVTFQTNDLLGETMAAWNLDGLVAATPNATPFISEGVVTLATPAGSVTVTALTGPVDTRDGRIAAVASTAGETRLGVAVIDFRGRSDYFFLPPAGRELDALVSDSGFDGLAAAPRGPGLSSALVFALDGGRVGYLDFDFIDTATDSVAVIGTYSAASVRGLALSAVGATGGCQVIAVATKPDDDLVLGLDYCNGTVAWGLPTAGARHVTVDHYLTSVVWVANDGDNDVQVVNTTTGRQVGRVSFDVAPTSVSVATGAAFAPPDPLALYPTDELYLVAGNPAAVLVHPLGFGLQACAWRSPHPAAIVRDPSSRAVWGASDGPTAGTAMELAELSGILPAFATGSPVGLPFAAAFAGDRLVVGHDGGLTAVSAGSVTGTWTPPSQPYFYNLGAGPAGELVVAGTWDLVDRVQLWDPAQIGATGAPLAEWTAGTDYVDWAVWLEDGLWVQRADYSTMTWTVSRLERSGSSLVEVQSVTPVDPIPYFVGTTPNGRALVRWENRAGGGTALRLFSADPATGFAETLYVALEGTLVGVTFDASGEHAYVVTQGPDRIVTVD